MSKRLDNGHGSLERLELGGDVGGLGREEEGGKRKCCVCGLENRAVGWGYTS